MWIHKSRTLKRIKEELWKIEEKLMTKVDIYTTLDGGEKIRKELEAEWYYIQEENGEYILWVKKEKTYPFKATFVKIEKKTQEKTKYSNWLQARKTKDQITE